MYIHLIFIYRHIQTFDSLDHFVLKNKIFKTPNLFTNCPPPLPLTCNMSRLLKFACRWILNFLKFSIKCLWIKCEQYYFTAIIYLSAWIRVDRPQFFILPKSFLASCVPDLKFDRLSSDIHNLATKLYPNRVVRIFLDWKFKKRI